MLFFPVPFYLTHANLRYRYPIDPLMTILAVYAIAYPLSWLAARAAARPIEIATAAQTEN